MKGITVGKVHVRALPKRGVDASGREYWEARWTADGKRYSRSLGWLTQDEATRQAARLVADGVLDDEADDAPIDTWADLIDAYWHHMGELRDLRIAQEEAGRRPRAGHRLAGIAANTYLAAEQGLKIIREHAGRRHVRALGPSTLCDLQRDLLRLGYAPQTTALHVNRFGSAWRWAWEQGEDIARPARSVAGGEAVRPLLALTWPDIHRIAEWMTDEAPAWCLAFLWLSSATGARPSEVASLRPEHVAVPADRRAGVPLWALPAGKTGARTIPVPWWAWDRVQPVIGDADQRVFCGWSRQVFGKWMVRAREALDMPAFTPMSMRRMVATEYVAAEQVELGARVVGHAPDRMRRTYARPRPEQLTAAQVAAGLHVDPTDRLAEAVDNVVPLAPRRR